MALSADNETWVSTLRREGGVELCKRFLTALAGRRVHIPLSAANARKGSPIRNAFDDADLDRICKAIGGEQIQVPIGERSTRVQVTKTIRDQLSAGRPAGEIAVAVGCGVRTVFAVKARMRDEGLIAQ